MERASVHWFGPSNGQLLLLAVLVVAAVNVWNKMPMWGQFFAILLGFPLIVALAKGYFVHRFGRLNGEWLLLGVLVLVAISAFGFRKHRSGRLSGSMSRQEGNRQADKTLRYCFHCGC
jgi:hypothetical protein